MLIWVWKELFLMALQVLLLLIYSWKSVSCIFLVVTVVLGSPETISGVDVLGI
jgi:hypothetical protein